MLLGGNHPRDGERRQRLRLVVDVLDLQPDHGELVGELFDGLVGVEMFLQPGQGEFHFTTTSATTVRTSATEIINVSFAVRSSTASFATTFWASEYDGETC